jgi:hypothetical protein
MNRVMLGCHSLAALGALALSACGGTNDPEPTAAASPLPAAAAPAPAPANDNFFAWIEWQFPDLFPRGPASQQLSYLGTSYTVRAYGTGNYAGLAADGSVYGLGPFTGQVLQGFGKLADWADPVWSSLCLSRPSSCVAPAFVAHPANTTVLEGQAATLTVDVNAPGPLSYQWRKNGADIAGATTATLRIDPVVLADDQGRIEVEVRNAAGTRTSQPATLTVHPLQWTGIRQQGVTPANDSGNAMVVDGQGNVIVGAFTEGDWPGVAANRRGKSVVLKYAPNGVLQWASQFNGNSVAGVGVDRDGNIYATGHVSSMTFPEFTSTNQDGYLVKLGPQGALQWARKIDSGFFDAPMALSVSADGHVVVVGSTEGHMDGSIGGASPAAFVARYDSNGNRLWVRQFDSQRGLSDLFGGVGQDADGNVYAVGQFDGQLAGITPQGGKDVVAVKLDAAGNLRWMQSVPTIKSGTPRSLAVNPAGTHVAISGWGYQIAGQPPTPGAAPMSTPFVALLRGETGATVWTSPLIPGPGQPTASLHGYGSAEGVAISNDGQSIFVTGNTPTVLAGAVSKGGWDAIACRLDADGKLLWLQQYGATIVTATNGAPPAEVGRAVAIDPAGDLFVAGTISGGTIGTPTNGYVNNGDVMVLKLRAKDGSPY